MTESKFIEQEMKAWHNKHFHSKRDWDKTSGEYLERSSQLDIARHFFELGIKFQDADIEADDEYSIFPVPYGIVKDMTKLEDKLSSMIVDAVHTYCDMKRLGTPHFVGLILGDKMARHYSQEIIKLAISVPQEETVTIPKSEYEHLLYCKQQLIQGLTDKQTETMNEMQQGFTDTITKNI